MNAYLRIISFIGLLAFAAVILIGLFVGSLNGDKHRYWTVGWLTGMAFTAKQEFFSILLVPLNLVQSLENFFQVFFPVEIWMQSHLSSYLYLTATLGHLLQAKNIYQVNF